MPEIFFASSFLVILFLPCLAAMLGLKFRRAGFADIDDFQFCPPAALGTAAGPVCALGLERSLSEDFEIRSFPKGLSVRRNLLRDGAAAVVEAVEKVLTAPTVAVAARQFVAGAASVAAVAVESPTTYRRGLMLRMVADKAEAHAWQARAQAAHERLWAMESEFRAGPVTAARKRLAEQLWAEEQRALEGARRAHQRVTKAEALLQNRADLQMQPQPAATHIPAAYRAQAA